MSITLYPSRHFNTDRPQAQRLRCDVAVRASANTFQVFGLRAKLGTSKPIIKEQFFRPKETYTEEAQRIGGHAPEEYLCIIVGEAGSCCRPGATKTVSRPTWFSTFNG